jgi:hypothetical protein
VSIKEAFSKLILDNDRVQLNGLTALLKKPTILMFAKIKG